MKDYRHAFDVDIMNDEEKADLLEMYIRQVKAIPDLPPDKEEDLIERMINGDEDARVTLIESKLKIVPLIAEIFRDRGLSLEDIIYAGNNGLIDAMANYLDIGADLNMYAAFFIVQAIRHKLPGEDSGMRRTDRETGTHRRIMAAAIKHVMEEGREPSNSDLAEELELPVETVAEVLDPVRWDR